MGLVDGKFATFDISPTTHCIAHNNPTTSHSWFNIDMGSKTVVQTVLIINREDNSYINGSLEQNDVEGRIIGSDLYVGENSLPY